jgi:hypothetical protein
MKTLLTFLLFFICIQSDAQNANTGNPSKNYLSLELDPAPFILNGYSFSLKYSPASVSHLAIMGSVFSSEFPDKMMDKSNYDRGFRNLKINTSYAFFTDYFLKPDKSGLYFGPSVFLYSKTVELNSSDEVANFKSIYPNVRIGYVYKPFKKVGFYLNPWFNVGKEFVLDNKNYIEGEEFSSSKLTYIIAIHLGYQFTF